MNDIDKNIQENSYNLSNNDILIL